MAASAGSAARTSVKLAETSYSIAGVFRCCIGSLADHVRENMDLDAPVGYKVNCKHCETGYFQLEPDGRFYPEIHFKVRG